MENIIETDGMAVKLDGKTLRVGSGRYMPNVNVYEYKTASTAKKAAKRIIESFETTTKRGIGKPTAYRIATEVIAKIGCTNAGTETRAIGQRYDVESISVYNDVISGEAVIRVASCLYRITCDGLVYTLNGEYVTRSKNGVVPAQAIAIDASKRVDMAGR